ncbi:MAG: hypothetical protein M1818_000542 [Claussenomyces sp. TS43310]|nr:MAG: hypothetical protein M1818_000542 [Claussenomyces sp. TS43310]
MVLHLVLFVSTIDLRTMSMSPSGLKPSIPTLDELQTLLKDRKDVVYLKLTTAVKVAKLGADIVVKYGISVKLSEGKIIQFLAEHTKIPVPKILALYTTKVPRINDPGSLLTINYIVMKFIPGPTLAALWPNLNTDQKGQIANVLRSHCDELRSIPAPNPLLLGNIEGGPLEDGLFWSSKGDPMITGPFESEEAFNAGVCRRLVEIADEHYAHVNEKFLRVLGTGHRTVLTHADLQRKNIMADVDADGKIGKITIIDWEMSGWYPEYWEYGNAMLPDWVDDWVDYVEQFLDPYYVEIQIFLMIRRHVLWC